MKKKLEIEIEDTAGDAFRDTEDVNIRGKSFKNELVKIIVEGFKFREDGDVIKEGHITRAGVLKITRIKREGDKADTIRGGGFIERQEGEKIMEEGGG
jgi:hypothetical protein